MFATSILRNLFQTPRKARRSRPRCCTRTYKARFELLEDRLCLSGTWTTEAPLPTPRFSPAAGVVDGILYVVGGQNPPYTYLARNDAYDPATNTWQSRAPMQGPPRDNLGVGVVNGILYAVGGAQIGVSYTTVEAYDPATDAWTFKAPLLKAVAPCQEVGVVNGILYVVGGVDDGRIVQAYNPANDEWTFKAELPYPVTRAAVGVVNNILYVVSGIDQYGVRVGTVQAYDPVTNAWTTKASIPTPREQLAVGVVNGILYAIGGDSADGVVNTVEAYDPTTDTWTVEPSMPTARHCLATGVADGVLYAVGGSTPQGGPTYLATNEAFTPAPISVGLAIQPGNAAYTGSPYLESNIATTLTPGTAEGTITYSFFADAGGTNPISDPTHAGTYYVQGHFTSSDTTKWTNADSLIASFTITQATLTGFATTQDAINIAKQGYLNINISGITGIVGSDTIASVFGSMTYQLTIGANVYTFEPIVTVVSPTEVNVAYTLRGGTAAGDALRYDLSLIDLGATSASKAKCATLWISAQNQDYRFVDDFFTRIFDSAK
jgi:N-acetylneuraminic acid mutarotase